MPSPSREDAVQSLSVAPTRKLKGSRSPALIIMAWFTAEGGRSVRANAPLLHFAFGMSVLVLVLARIVTRLTSGAPESPWKNGAMRSLTTAGHLVLYGLMIALPLTGWYAASGLGVPVRVAGIQIPAITASIQGPPGPIAEWHDLAGNLILVLAGVHALVVLYHQFILEDGTLKRMSLG